MLDFGRMVAIEWHDFGHDWIIPVCLRASPGSSESFALCTTRIEHAGPILCASVGTLAVERCRIMDKEENIEQRISRQNGLVKLNAHHFSVPGAAACYPVVVGRPLAVCVAAFDQRHAPKLTKHRVGTPETPATEDKLCHISSIRRYTKEVNEDEFQELLWQKGRELYRDMPWRRDTRPYYVLISELMLQQTQVDRVVPKFKAFVARFPDVSALAAASLSDVLSLWNGLGYNRRAKFVHEAAKMIMAEYDGRFPDTLEDLIKLPGVGPNTAGAILAYAFNRPSVFVETNVRTVYFNHFFEDSATVSDTELREVVARTLDQEHPREFYQALMDYGTWLKRQGGGRLTQSRHYKKQAPLKGSVREVRGQIVKRLTRGDQVLDELAMEYVADNRFEPALAGLMADGLVTQTDGVLHLTK